MLLQHVLDLLLDYHLFLFLRIRIGSFIHRLSCGQLDFIIYHAGLSQVTLSVKRRMLLAKHRVSGQ